MNAWEKMPRLVVELHTQHVRSSLGGVGFAESAKLEQAIKANLANLIG